MEEGAQIPSIQQRSSKNIMLLCFTLYTNFTRQINPNHNAIRSPRPVPTLSLRTGTLNPFFPSAQPQELFKRTPTPNKRRKKKGKKGGRKQNVACRENLRADARRHQTTRPPAPNARLPVLEAPRSNSHADGGVLRHPEGAVAAPHQDLQGLASAKKTRKREKKRKKKKRGLVGLFWCCLLVA